MKHSHLIASFGVFFALSTVMTNIFFATNQLLSTEDRPDSSISISSAKQHFLVSKHKGKKTAASGSDRKKVVLGSAGGMTAASGSDRKKVVLGSAAGMTAASGSGSGSDKKKVVLGSAAGISLVSFGQNETVRPIELLMPPEEIEWIRHRHKLYITNYTDEKVLRERLKRWAASNNDPDKYFINETTGFGKYQEDKEGPWMDFIVAGHPKTGTTTLVANLAKVAPMKVKDFCTSRPTSLMHYLYNAWPRKFPEIMDEPNRFVPDKNLQMVGSKCPKLIGDNELLFRYTLTYPRTKLIIGIRHPIAWYTSFINMGHDKNHYKYMKICPTYHNIDPINAIPGGTPTEVAGRRPGNELCMLECRCSTPICYHRARLHMGLAKVGKTALLPAERELLAPDDPDGGVHLLNAHARNPIFVYDQGQMKADSYWDELAKFLNLNYVPNHHYHSSHGSKANLTLCVPLYDEFRSKLMEHSYNMSVWLEDYLLPLGLDPDRPDVVIANTTSFREIIQTYKLDPCGRLERSADGLFVLAPTVPNEDGVPGGEFTIYTTTSESCRPKFVEDLHESPNVTSSEKKRIRHKHMKAYRRQHE